MTRFSTLKKCSHSSVRPAIKHELLNFGGCIKPNRHFWHHSQNKKLGGFANLRLSSKLKLKLL
jgi:hypothetical protein